MIGDVVNPLKHPGWKELLEATPSASFFHTENWARVLTESYGYEPRYFIVSGNGCLLGLLPVMEIRSFLTGRRGVSLPFTDFSDSFAKDDGQYRELADHASHYGKKARWEKFEIRGGTCPPWDHPENFMEYYGHRLTLGREEKEIYNSFRSNTRRNISRAIKSGVNVTFSNSVNELEAYYKLNLHTRQEHGIPPQPKRFFRKIQEHVLEKKLGTVVLASHEGKYVAGAVFFHFGTTVIYKYGASYDSAKQIRANNLVMWDAIRFYNSSGFKSFLFGRTDFDNTGLRDYKTGYGTEEEIIPYFKYDFRRNRPAVKKIKAGQEISKMYRHIPIPLSRLVGTLLYKHIG